MNPADREAAREELNSLLSSVLYTEKAHFAHEQRARTLYMWLGLISTLGGTLTAVTLLRDLAPWMPTTLAIIATICSALLTFVKPGDAAEAHAKSGRSLGDLRVRMRQYRDLRMRDEALTADAARAALAVFAAEKSEIDSVAESISDRVYRRAARRIREERTV